MQRRRITSLLAVTIGLQSFAPTALAQGGPGESRDSLGDAFANLKHFAREADRPAIAEVAPPAAEAEASPAAEAGRAEDLGLTGEVFVREWGFHTFILRDQEAAFRDRIAQLMHAMNATPRRTAVEITSSLLHEVKLETSGLLEGQTLRISVGTLALAQNWDELAAVVAQALARGDATVYGHRDDPRITRRLEEQAGFDQLTFDNRQRIEADLSAIERLRACDLRPWGLTDFELRVFSFYRRTFARKWWYWGARRITLPSQGFRAPFYEEALFEARILAQKVAITYLQERENLRDLIKTTTPFDADLEAVHQRASKYVRLNSSYARVVATWTLTPAIFILPAVFASGVGGRHLDALGEWTLDLARAYGLTETSLYQMARPYAVELLHALRAFWSQVGAALWALSGLLLEAAEATFEAIKNLILKLAIFGPFFEMIFNGLKVVFVAVAEVLLVVGHFIAGFFPNGIDLNAVVGIAIAIATTLLAIINRRFLKETVVHWYRLGKYEAVQIFAILRRLNYGRAVSRLVTAVPPGPARADLLRRIARDLHLVYKDAIAVGPFRGLNFDPLTLGPLRGTYAFPSDFWRLLPQFTATLEVEIAADRLSAAQTREIFETLDPKELSPYLSSHRFDNMLRTDFVSYEDVIAVEMLRWKKTRRALAALYRTTFERFPADRVDLAGIHGEVISFAALNETSVGESQFLGIARLAAEVELMATAPDARKLVPLDTLLFQRLRQWKVINLVYRRSARATFAALFDGGLDPKTARQVQRNIMNAKVGTGENDVTTLWRDGWWSLGPRLLWLRAGAFFGGDLNRAVAITTWYARGNEVINLASFATIPVKMLNAFAHWPVSLATSHAWRRHLRSYDSMRALANYVNRDLLPRNPVVEEVRPTLYMHVVNHPELLRTEDDVRALLDSPIFWPEEEINDRSVWENLRQSWGGAFQHFGPVDLKLASALNSKKAEHPLIWKYHSRHCGRLHQIITAQLERLGRMPRDYFGLKALWTRLSERGVTADTDRLAQQLITMAPPEDLPKLMELIVDEGRIWETSLLSRLAIARVKSQDRYDQLLAEPRGSDARPPHLDAVIEELDKAVPERGLEYARFLEDLSVRLDSTFAEAKAISRAKGTVSKLKVGDSNLESMRGVFDAIGRWPKRDQFNFIRFLRGDRGPVARVKAAFPHVGLERVVRMYEVLPLAARVGVLDSFLTHSLIGQGRDAGAWSYRLAEHIVGGQNTEAQKVSLQVLTAFLHAVRKVGNSQMHATVLSYLYALPSTATASPVEVLTMVLELFGATGIKVGQFTYASQILGPEGEILRTLQSRARVPDRIEMYEDVYDLLGVPIGEPLPFAVLNLLGAASMKYAFMGQDQKSLAKLVIKIFRLDAMNNVDLQFDVLEHMGDYLIKRFGAKYGAFRIIIQSARRAVRRESKMANEIRRSRIARHRIYAGRSTDEVEIEVPREDLINARMIIAQYAEGVTFDDLPDHAKPTFARALLALEDDILFADDPVIRFDPDRHAGNSQMHFRLDDRNAIVVDLHRPRPAIRPIDFGQLSRMTRAQRLRIVKLFALAQIAAGAGANDWIRARIVELLDLSPEQGERLRKKLKVYIRASQPGAVSRYMSVLAALHESGFAMRDITYIDFVRGIIQLTPFEKWAPGERAPSRTLERLVRAEAKAYGREFRFDDAQLTVIRARNRAARGVTWLTGRPIERWPTDLKDFDFDELIQRGKNAECEDDLAATG